MTQRLLKLTLLLCTLTLTWGVKAQMQMQVWGYANGFPVVSFSGTLVDSLTKEPLPAAVISVMTQESRSGTRAIRNFVSDANGNFKFKCFMEPRHRMEVATLGYRPYVRELGMKEEVQNLGVILMAQSTHEIDDVVVRSRLQMYKMKGDTMIFMPRAVNTMKGDAALEILRQMPGVEVLEGGNIKILGKPVERTYVNEKLLFGNDPTTALKELDAEEVVSIEAYDEVDEADAVVNGENARKRKVLNVVTFKNFTQSYSANARGEMGADFHKNAEGDRPLRYLASGNVNFYGETMQISASGGSNNLTAQNGQLPTHLAKRQSFASAKISGRSKDAVHTYSADYNYRGGFEQKRSAAASDYFPTDYFTSQSRQSETSSENESNSHNFSGDYGYTKDRLRLTTTLRAGLDNGTSIEQSMERTMRDGKLLTASEVMGENRNIVRNLDWYANGGWRFKSGNSISFSAQTILRGGQTRGELYELRQVADVTTPLAWETYTPRPDNMARGKVGYTLNFNKSGNLTFDSEVKYQGRAERQLYTDLATGVVDVVRSEDAFDKRMIWSSGARYMLRGEPHSLIADMSYVLENRNYADAKVGGDDRRNYHFAVGRFSYEYRTSKKYYNVSFGSDYSPVRARDFSSRINDTNPLYVSTGDKSLTPETKYTFGVSNEFMTKNGSYGFATQLGVVIDPVRYRRRFFKEATHLPEYDNYLMPAGSTLTTPENGSPRLQFSLEAKYKVRIAPLRLFVDISGIYNLIQSEEALYDRTGRELRHFAELRTTITTNFSKKFRITMENTAGLIFMNRFDNASREFRDVLKGTMEWDIVRWLSLKADYTGIFSSSPQLATMPTVSMLNLSLGYRILKERGRISINAYDVLNDYAPIRVSQTLDAISQNINYIGANYFTISFDYKFNNRKTN